VRPYAILRATVLTLAMAVLATSAARAEDGPAFTTTSPTVEADQDLAWSVPMHIQNPLDAGLYLDSLFLDINDHDPGETRVPRVTRVALTFLLQLHPSLSAQEDNFLQYSSAATSEHATLTFTLTAHDQAGHHWTRTLSVETAPGPGFAAHPSEFATVHGHKVEMVYVPSDSQPAPGLLMIHGHGNHARRMLRNAEALAQRGYHVMLVSMPGYGQSEGPPDFMGPATMEAATAALEALEHKPGVDAKRIGVWGVSRGATVAALLGERRPEVRAVVAQSGSYDLWATARGTRIDGFAAIIAAEVGSDSAAWRARSPLLAADHMHATVLVLHGERDANVPVGQAHAFAAALKSHGVDVEEKFFPAAEHMLPQGEVHRVARAFLLRTLAPR
jgi:dipeptidyl aminopeptidase/acylaminoacyl peptidase